MPSKSRLFSQLIAGSGQIKADRLSDDISTIEQVATTEDLTAVGNTVGDQRVINNNLYIWNGSGWYRIALINASPTWDSGGQPAASYELDADSPQDATVITLAASDPDGLSISYNYVTSGSMDSMATISQDSSVFTITPKTVSEVGEGAELTGSITFRASDGVNILPYVSSFTLSFITIIANSNHTTLLATATGTSDNNNITDASTNNHTITVNGDAHAGTFSPYRSGGYSTYFDGSGDWLELTGTALGNGNFTVEAWVWLDSLKDYNVIYDDRATGSSATGLALGVTSTGAPYLYTNNGFQITSSQTCTAKKWHHISLVRSSGVITIYLDGTSGGTYSSSANFTDTNLGIGVARTYTVTSQFGGYIRDVRAVVGTAITPASGGPTDPLEAVTNTSLLTCHLPYIADGSTNNHSITVNGDPTTKPFSPYDYLEYDAADHGGSVYFDGTGDYLVASNNTDTFGTGDFTLEGWIYRTATGATWQSIVSQRNGASTSVNEFVWGIHNSGYMYFYTGAHVASTAAGVIKLNQWHHIAFTRSGSTLRQFVDGIQQVSGTSSNNLTYGPMSIGNNNGGSELLTAFLSDIKTTKGTALYTSNFTPPTEPISSANSLLHIKGTDASIIDKSQVNNIKMNGPTTGSTTKSAFGSEPTISFASGSNTNRYLEFDPTVLKFMEILGQPSIPFTIEGIWGWQGSTASPIFEIFQDTNNFFYFGGGTGNTQSGISTDWNLYAIFKIGGVERFKMTAGIGSYYNVGSSFKHQAITRNSSGVMQHYYDGQLRTNTITHSGYDTVNWASPVGYVGRSDWMGAYGRYEGYIHQIRLTVGLARYTANFTPPTASLEG
jgi:hypothetical protein